MSVKRLQKQLIRDLKSSPKKAAILGLLVLVALYFWAPLLLGRRKTDEPPPATANTEGTIPQPTNAATSPAAAAETPVINWQEMATMIAADGRMSPAARANWSAASLGAVQEKTNEDEEPEEQEPADEPPPAITPAGLGLELTGTIVGGSRRVAIVNGHPYREGRTIELPGGVAFVVVEVAHKRAVLEREGERFELEVEELVAAGELAGDLVTPE